MTLDKEDHRTILLQLVMKNAFPGEFAETVVELKLALTKATLSTITPPLEPEGET